MLTGLTGHLKNHFPIMYRLFCVLKDRNSPPTAEEIDIASGKQALDNTHAKQYLKKLETASENILKVFERQVKEEAVILYLYLINGD